MTARLSFCLALCATLTGNAAFAVAQTAPPQSSQQRGTTAKPANPPAERAAPSRPGTSQQKPAAQSPPAAQAAAPNPLGQASLLGQYGDWGAYKATSNGRPLCFAIARPVSSQDKPAKRRAPNNTVYVFVSSRPSEKVKDEVSVLVSGYAFKANTDASIAVGGTAFPVTTQNDGAWLKNAADESRLVESMRKGSDLVLKSETSRGTESTDTFTLKGLGQALDRVAQECR